MIHRALCLLPGLAGLLALASTFALADPVDHDPSGESEAYYFADLPVVLGVSRLRQPMAEAPGAVTVIERETILASGAREIPDLFRLVPGFVVTYAGGAIPAVGYHGLLDGQFSKRMQVLVDGRPIYSPFFFGGANWNRLSVSIDDIERIEILRGSNSAAYGSNAFLGVANIVTRDPAGGREASAYVARGSDSIGDYRARVAGAAGAGKWRLTAEQRGDDGFAGVNDSKRVRLANLHADLPFGALGDVELQLGVNEYRIGQGFAGNPFSPPRDQHGGSDFVLTRWRHAIAPDEELKLRLYYARERLDDRFDIDLDAIAPASRVAAGLPREVSIDFAFRSSEASLELQHDLSLGRSVRLAWGGEMRRDRVESATFLGPGTRKNDIHRIFANLEWRPQADLLLNLAGTLEHNSLIATRFTPRLMANYRLAPGHTLRAGFSRAWRAPSMFEARANNRFQSNGRLLDLVFLTRGEVKPESINALELGYLAEYRPLDLSFDARLYHEDIHDLIVRSVQPLPAGFELRPASVGGGSFTDQVNAPHFRIRGLELQMRFQPAAGTRLRIAQAFTRIDAPDWPQIPGPAGREAVERSAPRHQSVLSGTQQLPGGLQLSATYTRVGAVRHDTDLLPQHDRLDWRLAYPFRGHWGRGEAAITVQNQLDPYAEFRRDFLFERRVIGALRLEF
jgi:iron complex outermembrane receptor protein